MQPLPMNELVQQSLNEVGFKVELEVLEWNALISAWRAGAKDPSSRGAVALNYSYFIQDPFTAFTRHVQSDLVSPKGTNWGHYNDKAMDALLLKAKTTFATEAQNKVLQDIHAKFVNEDLFLDITHDVNPRAMTAKVKGFVQAQNWFQDLTTIRMQ
jgi:ABC-type transport system substrate-binding protein